MALQTANQFQLAPNIASNLGGGAQTGQNIAGQFQLGKQRDQQIQQTEEDATVKRFLNSALELSTVPDDQKLSALKQNRAAILARGGETSDTDAGIALAESGDFETLNNEIQGIITNGERRGLIKPLAAGPSQFEQAKTAQVIAQTEQIGKEKPETVSALDKAKIAKINAEIAGASKGAETPALNTLIAGASVEAQDKAKAAYGLAGGGKDGLKALTASLETSVETEQRAAAPETLKANFPQADEAELQELQAVVDSSKTTESGFKAADKLRTKQRQVKKGKVFQKRAVDLLDRILGADELNDVIGSIEGSDESLIPFGGQKLRGDNESEIIADIEEAGNILTADNLDIMSGVLSETDIKIISNLAGGALNRKRGEAAFKKDVTDLRAKLAGQLGLEEKTNIDDLVNKYAN
jgi:hypothetical protein